MRRNTREMRASVLVLGATDALGEAVVTALLDAGQAVVAVADDPDGLDLLAARLRARGRLVTVVGSTRDEAAASMLVQRLARMPAPPRHAVVNLAGRCERGRILGGATAALESRCRDVLVPHALAAGHLIPLLAASGRCARYLVIGAPYEGTPWLGYAHQSVVGAAVRMLVQVVRQEALDTSVRVQELVLEAPVCTRDNASCASPDWPGAEAVARRVADTLTHPDEDGVFVKLTRTKEATS